MTTTQQPPDTLHFFPPNPMKLGDCLLTIDVAAQLAQTQPLRYYTTPFLAAILSYYQLENVTFSPVQNLYHSLRDARALRQRTNSYVDLQQLNCYYDCPQYSEFFDTSQVPQRFRESWSSAGYESVWGSASFCRVFQETLSLPPPEFEPQFVAPAVPASNKVLLFPHAENPDQQLNNWAEIAEALAQTHEVAIVARRPVFNTSNKAIEEHYNVEPNQLVKLIASASQCIGCSTGLSHLAAEIGIPTVILWKYNDYELFMPRNGSSVHVLFDDLENTPTILPKIMELMAPA